MELSINWDSLIAIAIVIFIFVMIYAKIKGRTLRESYEDFKDLVTNTE